MLTALQLHNIRVRNAATPNAPEIGTLIADLEERKAENERLAKSNAELVAVCKKVLPYLADNRWPEEMERAIANAEKGP